MVSSRKFFIFILCFLCLNTYAQKTTIYFKASEACEVCLFGLLDGGFNNHIQTETLTLSPEQPKKLVKECSSGMSIYCKIPKYERSCFILLIPNDTVCINIYSEEITYSGRNKEGLQYYNQHYARPLADEYEKAIGVTKKYVTGKIPNGELMKAYQDTLKIDARLDTINRLNVDSELRKILSRETKLFYENLIHSCIKVLADKKRRLDFTTSYEIENDTTNYVEIEWLQQLRNEVYVNNGLYSTDMKHWIGRCYISDYWRFHSARKSDLLGVYSYFLDAPKEMQPALLGSAARVQLEYHTEEMDMKKWLEYFETNFPESDYLRIIKKQLQEQEANEKNTENILFVERGITALSQLKDVPDLKGKYLFVDLWATWCNPCRAELAKAAELHQLLSSYNNVLPVYISIDGDKQDKAWRNMTVYYHLEGYHLRASSQLQASIKEQLYGSENISIPRYVLIAPDGSIAHKDLPRPSNRVQLKETLDGILLNK